MKNFMKKANDFVTRQAIKMKLAVSNNKGEGYIDTAVKILISVVIGALLLAGLYALIEGTVLPELQQRISDMFEYNG